MRAARLALATFALALAACSEAPLPPREAAPAIQPVEDWPKLPVDAPFGQVSAVDVDSQGRVFVLHRAGRVWEEPFPESMIADETVFVIHAETGELIDRWGADTFIMPHGLSVDEEGKVWITDVAKEQVYRFSAGGELELTLGEAGVTGDDEAHFGRPSDIAFDGERVLISDGYTNSRVIVFDQDGNYLSSWGTAGLGEGELFLPHAVATSGDTVWVADRENARVHVLDHDFWTKELLVSETKGHPYSMKPLGDGRLVVVEGRDAQGRTGALLRIYGADGNLQQTLDAGLPGDNASLGHDLAIGGDGAIYLTDVNGDRVVKLYLPDDRKD